MNTHVLKFCTYCLNPWVLGVLIGLDYWFLAWDVYNPVANKARFLLTIVGLILTVAPVPTNITYKKILVLLSTLGVIDILGKETLYQFEWEHFVLLLSLWAMGLVGIWFLPQKMGKTVFRWGVGGVISTWLGYQYSWIVLMSYGFIGLGVTWLVGLSLGGLVLLFSMNRIFNKVSGEVLAPIDSLAVSSWVVLAQTLCGPLAFLVHLVLSF